MYRRTPHRLRGAEEVSTAFEAQCSVAGRGGGHFRRMPGQRRQLVDDDFCPRLPNCPFQRHCVEGAHVGDSRAEGRDHPCSGVGAGHACYGVTVTDQLDEERAADRPTRRPGREAVRTGPVENRRHDCQELGRLVFGVHPIREERGQVAEHGRRDPVVPIVVQPGEPAELFADGSVVVPLDVIHRPLVQRHPRLTCSPGSRSPHDPHADLGQICHAEAAAPGHLASYFVRFFGAGCRIATTLLSPSGPRCNSCV